MRIYPHRFEGGFTLVELIVTVAIMAILARIGTSAYSSFVLKANRADAKNALIADAQALERCYSQYYYYQATGTQTACPTLSAQSPNGYYNITATTLTAAAFKLTAAPVAGGRQVKDTQCASFTIDNLGNQKASNSGGTDNSSFCWAGHN